MESPVAGVEDSECRVAASAETRNPVRSGSWWLWPLLAGGLFALLGLWLDEYLLYVGTSWIIFGVLALSLDLVWGRAGVLSLGQTAFYGLSGYFYGVLAINLAPLTGGNTLIWAIVAGIAMGGAVAAVVGYFVFYGRLGPLPVSIVTYTLTLVLWTGMIGLTVRIGEAVVGGANGMSYIPPLVLGWGPDAAPLSPLGMYLTVIAVAVLIYVATRALLRTPFGMVVDGSRMSDLKTELLGYDVRWYRLVLLVVSGAIAGVAGSLFAAWAAYINPAVFSVSEALLVPIYVLVGGRGTLVGAFVGALAVGGASFWLGGGVIGGQTTLVLGLALIALVIFFPQGLVGGLASAWGWGSARVGRADAPRRATPAGRPPGLGQGRPAPVQRRDEAGQRSEAPILETVGLTKRFGGVTAVDHVSLAFPNRRVHSLIGPNGAGKSTYLVTCAGLHRASEGRILLDGRDVTRWQPYQRVRAGLGIKLQVARVFDEFTTWENLWLAAYSRQGDRDAAKRVAQRVLAIVDLEAAADRLAGALSHGEQQWLDIGMVLCLDPKAILLDEPTAGMTPEETRRTAELVKGLARDTSVVVVDHDMEFVRMLDAPVTVLHQGAVFAQGTIDELRGDSRVLDIYLGRRRATDY